MGGKSYYISKATCVFIVLFVAALVAAVGLLAYVLSREYSCDDGAAGGPAPTGLPLHTSDTPPTGPPGPTTKKPAEFPWEEIRLPKDVVPDHYSLRLQPNTLAGTFDGVVTAEVRVLKPTRYILVNANLVTVSRVSLTSLPARAAVPVKRSFNYTANQFYVLEAEEELAAGKYEYKLEYSGSLVGNIVGFYRSSYVDLNTNTTHYVVSSKFQPTYARQAFPHWDEPNFKATFTVTLVYEPKYIALSNMPVDTSKDRTDGLKETTYQKSVKMSSYLVCFVIGDFVYREALTAEQIPFRVYSTRSQYDQTQYALDAGVQQLNYYSDYFGIPYKPPNQLPKLDMIAIPDFVSGAMEHWGLITYREVNLLFTEETASSRNKQRVCQVIAHELAHMWFGNLVTNDWWDDLWLQEGFASFLEYKGQDVVEPSWDIQEQFLSQDLQSVLTLDALVNSHPIVVPVVHPDDITSIFDAISYNKGASIIRMLEAHLGEEEFKKGVQKYLQANKFGNTVTDDLWDSLTSSEPGSVPVKRMMDTWTKQMGYPVVTVKRDLMNRRKGSLTQRRFLSDPLASPDAGEYVSPFGYKWFIPVSYVTSQSKTAPTKMIMDMQTTVNFDWPENVDWVKFNHRQMGFYRINYERAEWAALAKALMDDHNQMLPSDRSSLLDDAFSLAAAQGLSYDIPLSLTKYLGAERHKIPWDTAYDAFNFIKHRLYSTAGYQYLRKYIRERVRPVMNQIGWEDDGDHLTRMMRPLIISLACSHGDDRCVNLAVEKFKLWKTGLSRIPANLVSQVYKFGIQNVIGSEYWDHMWAEYKNSSAPQARSQLLFGMAQTKENWILSRYIKLTEDETHIKRQDVFSVLRYIAANPIGQPLVWSYLQENWPAMVDKYGLNDRYLGRLIPSVVGDFSTQQQLDEVLAFFKKYPEAGAGARPRIQALEKIKTNIAWLKNNEATVTDWLQANV